MLLRKTGLMLLMASFSILYFSTAAATPQVISLQQAFAYVQQNHPKLKMEQSLFKKQAAQVLAARSAALPHIQISSVYSNGMSGATSGLGQPALSNSAFRKGYGVSLDVEQTLYDFGRTHDKERAARTELDEMQWQEKVTLADILRNAADSYYECQRAKHYVVVYQTAYHNIRPLVQEIQQFVNTGQRSSVDLYLMKLYAKQIADDLISAKKYEQEAVIHLNLAVGAQSSNQYTCGENSWPHLLPSPHPLSHFLSEAKTQRPEVHALEATRSHLYYEKAAAKDNYYPRIEALASVGKIENTNVNEIQAKNYVVGVGIEIPLFDGYSTRAKVEKVEAQTNALFYKTRLTDEKIRAQVSEALLEYQRTKLLFNEAKAQRELASKALRLAQRRYLDKSGLLVEWEEAYRAWLGSEISYWDLGFEQKKAVAQLEYAAGLLGSRPYST